MRSREKGKGEGERRDARRERIEDDRRGGRREVSKE